MAVKAPELVVQDLEKFITNAKKALRQCEELKRRLESDENFKKLWEKDSGKALTEVGINPDARKEMGLPPYEKGPRCDWCITPNGNT